MKKRTVLPRLLSLALALLTVGSCFVALPASAANGLNDAPVQKPADILWDVDFNEMSSKTDNKSSTEYTLTSTSMFSLGTSPTDSTKKVLTINNSSGNYRILDSGCRLDDYANFSVEFEMYFKQFPSGNKSTSDATVANDYPLSLVAWLTKTPSSTSYTFRALRIDGDGYLCTAADSVSRTNIQLPLNQWFSLQLSVDPAVGTYRVTVTTEQENGLKVETFASSFPTGQNVTESLIRFFDGYYKYSACISKIQVYPSDSASSTTKENGSDYYGYQTTPIAEDGTFDVRFLSALDPTTFSDNGEGVSNTIAQAGYELTAVWKENGEIKSDIQTIYTPSVYHAIRADGETFSHPDGDYIHAIALRGVDSSISRIEFVIQPFTTALDGTRVFGDGAILVWSGEIDDKGFPVLAPSERTAPYLAAPSDDTFVGFQTNVSNTGDETRPNGSRTIMYLKNGSGTQSDRAMYVQFALSDIGISRVSSSHRIVLRLYCQVAPKQVTSSGACEWSEEELAAGGVFANVYGTSTGWSEDTLCADNYTDVTTVRLIQEKATFKEKDWLEVDVTDYVREYVKNNPEDHAVSFKIEKTVQSNMGTTTTFRSKEYSSAQAPQLLVYPTLYNHEINLAKINNQGSEPWGYAEKLVADWVNDGYKKLYTAGDVQWHVDFDKMSSVTDNGGSDEYTLTSGSNRFALAASPTNPNEKVLSLTNHAGHVTLTDTQKALGAKDSFSVEADFLFTQFPYGGKTTSDPTTAKEAPLNLIRWMPTSSSFNYGVRIDSDGYLYTVHSGSYLKSEKHLTLGKWHNIRLDYNRAGKTFTVFLDDQVVATESLTQTVTLSKFMLLDSSFKYTVNVKDIRVYNGEYATFDLDEAKNTTETGAYDTPIQWRANQMKNKVNSKIYTRSIASLANKAGYDMASVDAPLHDQYGGITNAGFTGKATGFFHTEIVNGRTYIIDPLGNPYFAVGMNTVELGATENQKAATVAKYGSAENFYSSISQELRSIGVNTVWGGEWKKLLAAQSEDLYLGTIIGTGIVSGYMSSLKLSNNNSSIKFKHNNTMNVFDPDFVTFANTKTASVVDQYGNDPRIIGWTSDNEISAQASMLYDYLTIDPSDQRNAFSYATAWAFLRARTGKANPSTEDITHELGEEFKAFVYDRYYRVVTNALKNAGAKQMYMGNRIHSENRTSEGYLRAASQYVDVLTVNLYGGPEPPINTIEYMYRYSGKSIVVTEFYAKAQDATDMNGIPLMNQTNAGWIVKTQEDRAAHYENYVLLLLESRCCVGWTWYRFRDNDQRVYRDDNNNVYVDHDVTAGAITSYVKVGTGSFNENGTLASITFDQDFLAVAKNMDLTVAGDPYLPFVASDITAADLTVVYKGEYGGDNSNNGSNKGLYDNRMNIYQPLADAYARVDQHIMGLVNYFDTLHSAE